MREVVRRRGRADLDIVNVDHSRALEREPRRTREVQRRVAVVGAPLDVGTQHVDDAIELGPTELVARGPDARSDRSLDLAVADVAQGTDACIDHACDDPLPPGVHDSHRVIGGERNRRAVRRHHGQGKARGGRDGRVRDRRRARRGSSRDDGRAPVHLIKPPPLLWRHELEVCRQPRSVLADGGVVVTDP